MDFAEKREIRNRYLSLTPKIMTEWGMSEKQIAHLFGDKYQQHVLRLVFASWDKNLSGFLEVLDEIPILDNHRQKIFLALCQYLKMYYPLVHKWLINELEVRPEDLRRISPNA